MPKLFFLPMLGFFTFERFFFLEDCLLKHLTPSCDNHRHINDGFPIFLLTRPRCCFVVLCHFVYHFLDLLPPRAISGSMSWLPTSVASKGVIDGSPSLRLSFLPITLFGLLGRHFINCYLLFFLQFILQVIRVPKTLMFLVIRFLIILVSSLDLFCWRWPKVFLPFSFLLSSLGIHLI